MALIFKGGIRSSRTLSAAIRSEQALEILMNWLNVVRVSVELHVGEFGFMQSIDRFDEFFNELL
jgi:hypothetical protein